MFNQTPALSSNRQTLTALAAMASSPADPNGGVAGAMKKYRTFVRRHRALLSAIEQGAAGMTWFAVEGENSEVWAEAASSAVGVVSTLNGHLKFGDESDDDDDDDEGDARSSPTAARSTRRTATSRTEGRARRRHRRSAQGIRAGRRSPRGGSWRERLRALAERPRAAIGSHPVLTGGDAVGDDREEGQWDGGRGPAVVVMERSRRR